MPDVPPGPVSPIFPDVPELPAVPAQPIINSSIAFCMSLADKPEVDGSYIILVAG